MSADIATDSLALGCALAAAAILTPVAIRAATRGGLLDHPAPHKFHQRPTPYLGGLALILAVIVVVVPEVLAAPSARVQLIVIVLGGIAVAVVGLVDDLRTLGPWPRLAVQAAAAVGLWISGIRAQPSGVAWLDLLVTVLIVLAVTNAMNLLDNMDGLSAGTTAIVAMFFLVIADGHGQHPVALLASALAGACLGFMPYNFNPARIFLGDAGALFMGFVVASLALMIRVPAAPLVIRVAVPALVLFVPLFDMCLVVLSRWRGGRPILRGGTDHSSHRLAGMGFNPRATATATYLISGVAGLLALAISASRSVALAWGAAAVAIALGLAAVWALERSYTPASGEAEIASAPNARIAVRSAVDATALAESESAPSTIVELERKAAAELGLT